MTTPIGLPIYLVSVTMARMVLDSPKVKDLVMDASRAAKNEPGQVSANIAPMAKAVSLGIVVIDASERQVILLAQGPPGRG